MTSTVPAPTFGPNGFIIPASSVVLAATLSDIDTAFGGNLNLALTTPQGQLGSSEAAVINEVNQTFLFLTQQFDPAFASGRYQDALARIYFIERNPAEATTVQANCVGAVGTVIPAGSIALATDGNQYVSVSNATIPGSGTVSVTFVCAVLGPIPCPAHSLTQIYRFIPGWDSIDNPSEGVLGSDTETRAEFETRRQQSVAGNSQSQLQSVLGAVLALPGVLDVYVTENVNSTPTTIGGVTLAPHSIYVAVVGGDQTAIATTIWEKKAPGCAYNGNTAVNVQDTSPGYSPPYPTYSVQFEIPDSLPILFSVNIANNSLVPADATAQIQNAIINAFAGDDGGPRAGIGSTLYASRFYAPVAALGSWVQIISIQVGTVTANANDVSVDIDQVPTISAGDISVMVT